MIRTQIFPAVLLSLMALFPSLAWAVSGDVVKEFATPGHHPTGLTYDATTRTLWLADRMTDRLYQINPKDGSVVSSLAAPDFQIEGLAMANGKLWAIDTETSKAYLLNPKTGVTERTIDVFCRYPKGLAFDGKYLWTGGLDRHDSIKSTPRMVRRLRLIALRLRKRMALSSMASTSGWRTGYLTRSIWSIRQTVVW